MQLYKEIGANKRRSVALVVLVAALLVALGYGVAAVFGYGYWPLLIAFGVVLLLSVGSYWYSDKVALAMSHARPADPEQYAQYHNVVEGLCIAVGIPKPRLYVVDDPAPNAFATGRNPGHAAVAVTTGLLETMNRDELEGVLAHELSHVRNYDILVSSMVIVLVGAIVLLSDFSLRFLWWGGPGRSRDREAGSPQIQAILAVVGIVLIILAPVAAKLIQYAVSRKREALADVSAVEITRYPAGLRSALEKLRDDHTVVRSASRSTAHLWIEEPLDARKGKKGAWLNRMFLTHPPIEERIETLRGLESAG